MRVIDQNNTNRPATRQLSDLPDDEILYRLERYEREAAAGKLRSVGRIMMPQYLAEAIERGLR